MDVDEQFPISMGKIDYALNQDPSPKSKPVLATVKGVGGGKTRFCEESRQALNARDDTLAIGITFNNLTPYSTEVEMFIADNDFLKLNMMLSVMSRIAMVVYEKPFDEVRDMVRGSINQLPHEKLRDPL